MQMKKNRTAHKSSTESLPTDLARCEILSSIYDSARRLGVSHDTAVMICAETQTEWAGQQAYIPRDAGDSERIRTERDAFILSLQRAGMSYEVIARKVEHKYFKRLTRQRIGQIVSSADL